MKHPVPVGLGSVYAVWTISYGTHLGVPVSSSRPSIHNRGASGWYIESAVLGRRATSTRGCLDRRSLTLPRTSGWVSRSAMKASMLSMTPDARAAARVSPLPSDTVTDLEFGRQTVTTGRPITSSPVISAARVIPIAGKKGRTDSSVSSGERSRWVPSLCFFGASPAKRIPVPGQ